jgi:hypothetical protein
MKHVMEDKICSACSRRAKKRVHLFFGRKIWKEETQKKDLVVDGKIVSKWTGWYNAGFIWLRIGTNGGFL